MSRPSGQDEVEAEGERSGGLLRPASSLERMTLGVFGTTALGLGLWLLAGAIELGTPFAWLITGACLSSLTS